MALPLNYRSPESKPRRNAALSVIVKLLFAYGVVSLLTIPFLNSFWIGLANARAGGDPTPQDLFR